MRLIGVAMAKNEADVIEAFVRHNLRYLDRLVVIDHSSDDATGEILLKLRDEGLPLTVGLDRSLEFDQGARVTPAIKQALEQFDADAAFALDADEFLVAESRAALDRAVESIPPGHYGQIRWTLYVPGSDPDAPHPFGKLSRRVVDPRLRQTKAVVLREFAGRDEVQIGAGNHWVFETRPGDAPRLLPTAALDDVQLAHLPFRSVEQVTQKIVLGHFAHRLAFGQRTASAHVNWHWKHVYERIRDHGLAHEDLALLAVQSYLGEKPFEHADATALPTLVEAPLKALDELRYRALARVQPFGSLLRWTERLLEQAGH